MMTNIRLDDGRIIGSRNFEVHDNELRRLTAADKWAIKWAERVCPDGPGFAIALATRHGVLCGTAEAPSADEAIRATLFSLRRYYNLGHKREINSGIVAVLNFSPLPNQGFNLGSWGVTVIYLRKRYVEDRAGREQEFREMFIGPHWQNGELMLEPRVFIQPKLVEK